MRIYSSGTVYVVYATMFMFIMKSPGATVVCFEQQWIYMAQRNKLYHGMETQIILSSGWFVDNEKYIISVVLSGVCV